MLSTQSSTPLTCWPKGLSSSTPCDLPACPQLSHAAALLLGPSGGIRLLVGKEKDLADVTAPFPPIHHLFLGGEQGSSQANSLLELAPRKERAMPEKWGCGGEWSRFSTSYPGRNLLRAGLPQLGLQGGGGALFYELLQNQESLSKRLPHLIATLPAVS